MILSLNVLNAQTGVAARRATSRAGDRRNIASTGTWLFGLAIACALAWGWMHKGQLPTAERGTGYYLGIVGGLSMLALLLYPVRKHARFMRKVGSVGFWFRTHMALGLIGPTLILYHANFGLGSINSNVALWSMLIVAGSGIVGRFFYAKIHKGLYGAKADLRNLAAEAKAFRERFNEDLDNKLVLRIDKVERDAFADEHGMGAAAVKLIKTAGDARSIHRALRRELKKALSGPGQRRALRDHLDFCDRYFRRVEQAAELGFYERLFAAWHLLHLPLFILLILTAIVHVIAVHLY